MDGLSNISKTHPHFTPPVLAPDIDHDHLELSMKPSYEAILDTLRSEPPNTITLIALGPRTSLVAGRI